MSVAPALYLHEFPGGLEWVNAPPIALGSLRGVITLLHFWSGSSVSCHSALADLKFLQGKFPTGFAVIGVHTPKFTYEASTAQVLKTINRLVVRHPVINDSGWLLWRTLGIQAWPTSVVLDAEGKIAGILFLFV